MSLEETFACLVGAYYGVREMDLYPLKEYVLHDLQIFIEDYVKNNELETSHLFEKCQEIEEKVSLKTKLHDALLMLPKVNGSLELVLMIKEKIRNLE